MSSTFVDTAGVPDAKSPRHRHPGLYVSRTFRVMYGVGIIGCLVDATLALPVINKGLHLPMGLSILIMALLGVIAADGATTAATALNNGKRGHAVFALIIVATLGVLLAWARMTYGLSTETIGTVRTDRDAGNQTHDEIPATAMMLGLYCVSMISVFLAAIKIFHPARGQLRKHDKERRKVSRELAPLEADLVAIHERIATRAERFKKLCEQREQVQRQVDAREGALKAFSRDAIARALGDPSSTPLVRAPHEPGEAQAGSQGSPVPPRPFPV